MELIPKAPSRALRYLSSKARLWTSVALVLSAPSGVFLWAAALVRQLLWVFARRLRSERVLDHAQGRVIVHDEHGVCENTPRELYSVHVATSLYKTIIVGSEALSL